MSILAIKSGRFAGSFGDLAIFSLQQSKILTCGEGGMTTTNSDEYAELVWSLRHYGRTKTGKWCYLNFARFRAKFR